MEKILIIDDEKPTLSMFRLFLGAFGYSAFTAENGPEGIEAFKRERPPIVFTDIKMPGMDGMAVLKAIKEIEPRTQVVVITGHGDMDLAVAALNLGATDFIDKPVQRSALDAALKRAEERFKMGPDYTFTVDSRKSGKVTVVDITGNIGAEAEAPLFAAFEAAEKEEQRGIVLNFDGNFTINGEGIAAVVNLLSAWGNKAQAIAVCGVSENFRGIFDKVGIARLAPMYATEEEAVTLFQGT